MLRLGINGIVAVAIVVLDRWSKLAIADWLPLYSSKTMIEGFFDIVHTRNTGIAFSLFADAGPVVKNFILPAVSIAAIGLIVYMFAQTPNAGPISTLALTLVLAGAVGNLYDRFAYGYVVDFLDVYVGTHHWPAFNVADSSISVGAVLLLITSFGDQAPNPNEVPKT